MNNKKNREIICLNCGRKGHIYKKCHLPIVSYGIICVKINNLDLSHLLNISKLLENKVFNKVDDLKVKLNLIDRNFLRENLKFLMIRRRNSFSYIEFIRGKYKIDDIDYILNNLRFMSNYEKNLLLTNSFDENWNYVWNIYNNKNTNKKYSIEYEESKLKFEKITKGFDVNIYNNKIFINLEYLMNQIENKYKDTEWGFPKGRKEQNETEKECACREFEEETDFSSYEYETLKMNPVNELFMGSNKVKYKHKYFIAQCKGDKMPKINENNSIQKMEISGIEWFTIDECNENIRDYNIEKKNIISNLYFILENYILELKKKIDKI